MNKVVIDVKDLIKKFNGVNALDGISFSINSGEIFGFLGPSGSGKTTTVKILTKQIADFTGEVSIFGRNISEYGQSFYKQIGIVTDTSGLYENLSILDNLLPFAMIHNLEKGDCLNILEKVGLEIDAKKKVKQLSKGMKQRVIIARSLLHSPAILFLDEPTNGLDPANAQKIHHLLFELRNKGTSIFLTTHNMNEASLLCDNLALLFDGKIVESGNPKTICLKYNKERLFIVTDHSGKQFSFGDNERQEVAQKIMDGDVETIHSSEPTLEDVFLQITGRRLSND